MIAVLRALGLGDLLTGVPALRGLRRAFPDDELVLAAPKRFEALAAHAAAVDRVEHTAALGPLPIGLHGATVAVDLHGRGPESQQMLLQGLPGRLISFFHPDLPVTAGSPEWRRDEHEVHRWCRMLKGYGIDCDPSDLDIKPPGRTAVSSAEAATLIHPGAAFAARRWPPERFSAVARSELAKGRKVVVTAGPAEVELGRRVLAGAGLGEEHLWVGGDDPFELVDIVAMADRVVCGDTGVSHVATAVATPSVILFGPTPPEWWGPPPERRWHVALWAGGHGEPNADKPDAGLLAITVDQVNAALDRLDDVVGA